MSSALFTIDREFAELCPPLTSEERNLLRASIESEGCQQPVVVWQEERLLLDGHNRTEICQQLQKQCASRELSLPSREAAIEWIITNQLGRRNVTEQQKSYLRGKRYQHEKKKAGAPVGNENAKQCPQNGNIESSKRTVERMASELGVSKNTVLRDAQYATAVDVLASNIGPHIRGEILSGQSHLTKQAVVAISQKPAERQLAEVVSARVVSSPLSGGSVHETTL